MSLGYQAGSAKQSPHLVTVLGAPGSGKTVYLGMLTDILSRHHGFLEVLGRGAFSVALQQQAVTSLARYRFPPRTSSGPESWNWVQFEVTRRGRRRPVELVLPDVSGQCVMAEIERAQSYPMIRSFLSKCSAALVVIDTDELEARNEQADLLARQMLSYLLELEGDRKRGWPSRPVALVFSKADRSEACYENPTGYAAQRAPALWRLCTERFKRHRFFAATVVGACARVKGLGDDCQLPLRVEPRGVEPPFEWLVEHLG